MRVPTNGVEPTFFSRHECKYFVSPALLPDVRAFLRPFTRPDEYAAHHPGHRYPVCSLYLDSDDLLLYHQVVRGEKKRFKLRVRTYSDEPGTPAYFEVKSKINAIVHKIRAAVDRERARTLLSRGWVPTLSEPIGSDRAGLDTFLQHAALVGAKPVLRVKYMREAYQGTADEPTRLTIDTDLVHAVTFGPDFGHATGRWVRTPTDGAIIEIKFTERFPSWIQELVRGLGLHQRAVPKYVLSTEHMLRGGRRSALALGDELLPPFEATP
jgi:hypothetical protein